MTAISDLDIFARVARTGNMSAAGREMGLSPAVVSKRVSLLEERLGARLFQRTTRQLTLTETGEGYFKRVVDILEPRRGSRGLRQPPQHQAARHAEDHRADLASAALHIAPHLGRLPSRYSPRSSSTSTSPTTSSTSSATASTLPSASANWRTAPSSPASLSPDNRVICAAPAYLEKRRRAEDARRSRVPQLPSRPAPRTAGAWRVPAASEQIRVNGNIRSNSRRIRPRGARHRRSASACVRTWDIGPELQERRAEDRAARVPGSDQRRDLRGLSVPRLHAGESQRLHRVPLGTLCGRACSARRPRISPNTSPLPTKPPPA